MPGKEMYRSHPNINRKRPIAPDTTLSYNMHKFSMTRGQNDGHAHSTVVGSSWGLIL